MAAQGGEVPWSEKYRPRTLDEVGWAVREQVLQRRRLGGFSANRHCPHAARRLPTNRLFAFPRAPMINAAGGSPWRHHRHQ